jgi:hypothetical protein
MDAGLPPVLDGDALVGSHRLLRRRAAMTLLERLERLASYAGIACAVVLVVPASMVGDASPFG